MYLSSTINKGMVQILDRLCGSTVNTYSYKDKMSDFNDALDWYFSLAFKADGQWNFDDINKSSPPIDTQNIVSGTNRYKVSSFTEKILNLIKLEVLDGDAKGHILIPETIDDLNDSFQERYLNTTNATGVPTHYCKYGDYIYLYPTPDYSESSGLKAYFNRPASKFEFISCSIANGASALVTSVGHGLIAGDTVIFETDGTLNTGLTADLQYYVISAGLTNDVFEVSTTLGGTAVTTSSTGSGCHFLKTSTIPGIVSIHHPMLIRRAALSFLSYVNSNKLGTIPQQVMLDTNEIQEFYSNRTKDSRKILTPTREDNR